MAIERIDFEVEITRLPYNNGSDESDQDNGREYYHVMASLSRDHSFRQYERGCALGRGFSIGEALGDFRRRFIDWRKGLAINFGTVDTPPDGEYERGSARGVLLVTVPDQDDDQDDQEDTPERC